MLSWMFSLNVPYIWHEIYIVFECCWCRFSFFSFCFACVIFSHFLPLADFFTSFSFTNKRLENEMCIIHRELFFPGRVACWAFCQCQVNISFIDIYKRTILSFIFCDEFQSQTDPFFSTLNSLSLFMLDDSWNHWNRQKNREGMLKRVKEHYIQTTFLQLIYAVWCNCFEFFSIFSLYVRVFVYVLFDKQLPQFQISWCETVIANGWIVSRVRKW